jgi:Tol biopolymer transport system component
MTPAPSPGADRLFFTRSDNDRQFQNWLSSVSGGPAVRLTTTRNIVERGGSWSPNGGMIVYWEFRNGVASVMVVRTTGEATPVKLREHVGNPLPDWSPDGQWIKFMNPRGRGRMGRNLTGR